MDGSTGGNLPAPLDRNPESTWQLFDSRAHPRNGALRQDMRGHYIGRQVDAGVEIHAASVGLSGLIVGKQMAAGLPSSPIVRCLEQ
jgi:hypothetical protein